MSEAILNFHDAVILSITFQSFCFVVLILAAKQDRHVSDYFLAGFFLAQAAIPLHVIITYSETVREIAVLTTPNLFHLFEAAYWIEGPLLLWYTRSLLYKEFKFERSDALYLVPVAFFVAYVSSTFYDLETAAKIEYLNAFPELEAPSAPHLLQAARETVFVVFGFACLNEILQAQKNAHDRHANIKRIDFLWLGTLIAGFMIARTWTLLVTSLAFLKPKLGPEIFNTMGLLGNYLTFAVINVLIFFSLTRSSFVAGKAVRRNNIWSLNSQLLTLEFREKVETHMRINRPYLSQFFSIEVLANQMSADPDSLSQSIRSHFNKNFNEYVNSYRVEEAKKILSDPNNSDRPLLDILSEVGFTSKTTFQAFFKRLVGMSPEQYRKSSREV